MRLDRLFVRLLRMLKCLSGKFVAGLMILFAVMLGRFTVSLRSEIMELRGYLV